MSSRIRTIYITENTAAYAKQLLAADINLEAEIDLSFHAAFPDGRSARITLHSPTRNDIACVDGVLLDITGRPIVRCRPSFNLFDEFTFVTNEGAEPYRVYVEIAHESNTTV